MNEDLSSRKSSLFLGRDTIFDFLSVIAFVLSLVSTLYIFAPTFYPAKIRSYSPPQVVLFFTDEDRNFVSIASRLAYTNLTTIDVFGTISREVVRFRLSDSEVEMVAVDQRTFESDGSDVKWKVTGDAAPFSLRGGESKSRELSFAPFPNICPVDNLGSCEVDSNFVSRSQMLVEFRNTIADKRTLDFEFLSYNPRSEEFINSVCKSDVSSSDVKRLALRRPVILICR